MHTTSCKPAEVRYQDPAFVACSSDPIRQVAASCVCVVVVDGRPYRETAHALEHQMPYWLQLVLSFVVEVIVYHGHYIVISMHKQGDAKCSLPCVLLGGHMSGGCSPGMR